MTSRLFAKRLFVSAIFATVFVTASVLGQTVLSPVELRGVSLDLAASAEALDRAQAAAEDARWSDAVARLAEAVEANDGALVPIAEGSAVDKSAPPDRRVVRLVPIREAAHLLLNRWERDAPEALAAWRERFDGLAATTLQNAGDDPVAIVREAERHLVATPVAQALRRAGELALRKGQYELARRAWRRLRGDGIAAGAHGASSEPDVADSHALLGLIDALAPTASGSPPLPLDDATRAATARIAGVETTWGETVDRLFAETRARPLLDDEDWPTLGGETSRARSSDRRDLDLKGTPLWSIRVQVGPITNDVLAAGALRVADDGRTPATVHPVVARSLAIVVDETSARAIETATGKTRWRQPLGADVKPATGARQVGARIHTATVAGDLVYVRAGAAAASSRRFADGARRSASRLLAIELETGKIVREWSMVEPGWAFSGPAVVDRERVFVPLRHRLEGRPQSYVACYDATTGELRWRRRIVAADVPGRGEHDELGADVMAYDGLSLFLNTHLGAVAAIDADSGRPRWVVVYPRTSDIDVRREGLQGWRQRVGSPCVIVGRTVFAAPADAPMILALDRETGAVQWVADGPAAYDAVHLLGVTGDSLVATGDSVHWLDVRTGASVARAPYALARSDNRPQYAAGHGPRGFGRGTLVGKTVVWPVRDRLWLMQLSLPQSTESESDGDFARKVDVIREVPLAPRGAVGGSVALFRDGTDRRGRILVSSAAGVWCFADDGAE